MPGQISRSLFAGPLLGLALVLLPVLAPPAAAQSERVYLYGVSGEAADNIRAVLDLQRHDCDTPHWRMQRLLRDAPQRIARALRAVGYYAPVISAGRLTHRDDCWQAHFDIETGPRIEVERMDVSVSGPARDEARFEELLADMPLNEGQPLHHGRYEATKSALLDLGTELGYFAGRLTHSVLRVDPEQREASIEISYESGPRYRFGEVEVRQEILDADFIQRYITIEADTPYDARQVSDLYQGLADSGYFREVRVRPEIDHDAQSVPIQIDLPAMARHTHTFGIGAATDTGPRISYSYTDRRINQRGHRLNGSVQVSAVGSELGGEYRIPARDPRHEWYSLHAAHKAETTDTSDSSRLVTGLRRTRQLSKWLETTFIEVQRETFTVADEKETSNILMPGISWSRSRSDNPTYPRSGYQLSLELRGATDQVYSSLSFAQARLQAKRIWGLPFGARLLVRGEVGVSQLDAFERLPASLRFFTGGDNSVRGYAYQSLGPVDEDGEVVGGRHLLVGSIELDWAFAEKWSVAAFADEGNAIDNANDDLVTGVGVGLRWRSPIGPIRFDFAHPLDDPDTDIRFHLSMGLDL